MTEPDEVGATESTGEFQMAVDGKAPGVVDDVDLEGRADEKPGAEAAAQVEPEAPRRRLVSELLEGQEVLEETTIRPDLQIVAPPLHLEDTDAAQPFYQLDLSSGEPEGTFVDPEPGTTMKVIDAALGGGAASEIDIDDAPSTPLDDAYEVVKRMILHRDRQVMAAERDGIGAYELAVGLDAFVYKLVEAVRDAD